MRVISVIVAILGLFTLVLGIIFIIQAGSAEETIATEIQPVTIAELDAKYDAVKAKQMQLRQVEEPAIQEGKAAASDTYNYLTIQRTALGLARANVGTTSILRMNGILDIVIGAGFMLAGIGLFRRSSQR